jgi:hypothetical protein
VAIHTYARIRCQYGRYEQYRQMVGLHALSMRALTGELVGAMCTSKRQRKMKKSPIEFSSFLHDADCALLEQCSCDLGMPGSVVKIKGYKSEWVYMYCPHGSDLVYDIGSDFRAPFEMKLIIAQLRIGEK